MATIISTLIAGGLCIGYVWSPGDVEDDFCNKIEADNEGAKCNYNDYLFYGLSLVGCGVLCLLHRIFAARS